MSCPTWPGRCPTTAFADVLGLPTIWIPHTYRGCNQHAPNEHVLKPLSRDAMHLMAGLYWDIGTDCPAS